MTYGFYSSWKIFHFFSSFVVIGIKLDASMIFLQLEIGLTGNHPLQDIWTHYYQNIAPMLMDRDWNIQAYFDSCIRTTWYASSKGI